MRHIPAETSTFVFDTTNTKLANSGDCVVRSISLALGKTWTEVFDALVSIARSKCMMPNDDKVFYTYLEQQGWKVQRQPRKADNTKYKAKEFVKRVANGRRCIFGTSGHLSCCFEDGRIHDVWDCGEWTVGRFWVKA